MAPEGTPHKGGSLEDMAKRKDAPGKRHAATPVDGDHPHPAGLTDEEIAKVLADVEECFRRQSEFFSRMAQRGRMRLQHRR
jgi:hypothetical protein